LVWTPGYAFFSRGRPKYLISFAIGIVWLLNVTGGQSRFLNENVT